MIQINHYQVSKLSKSGFDGATLNTDISKRFLCILVLCTTSISVFASGFRLPESSVSGMALSNAVVANPELSGALIYNPSLMSSQNEPGLVNFGFSNIHHNAEVTPDNGNSAESKGENNVQIPSFYYMSKPNLKWSWGVGLYAPFGLETEWPDETFSAFDLAGAQENFLEPEASKLEVLNLTPNIAYQIDSNNSVAFGINYYLVRELVFNTQAVQISADGNDWGYTLAYHYNRGPWDLGATYRSAVESHVDGSIFAAGFTGSAEADIEFPKMIQVGIRNELNKIWSIEFDIERTYWSSFDSIDIKTTHPSPQLQTITSTNNWNDVNAYRIGISYMLSNYTQLLFGYTRDESPQPDKYFSARIPDADRQLFSVGFTHKLEDSWTMESGIMIVKFKNRRINQPAGSYGANLLSGNTDANGTDAYNGKYESDAWLFGIGFSKNFAK